MIRLMIFSFIEEKLIIQKNISFKYGKPRKPLIIADIIIIQPQNQPRFHTPCH